MLCGRVYYIKAENISLVDDGKVIFITSDKKATSGTRWKTVGFTITREKCLSGKYGNGGYPTKLEHATIHLKESWKEERSSSSTVYVTFTIPQSVVSKALIKAGMGDIKNDDVLYLHGIFQVTHNGNDYGGKKYSLPAIASAESWANPDDFKDRFDVKVFYKAPDEPISVQYKTSTGYIIDTETYAESKWEKPGTKLTVKLAESKTYQGKKYQLYKSYIRNFLSQKSIAGYGANMLDGDSLNTVQNKTINQQVGGVQFVAVMKQVKEPKLKSEKNLVSEWDEPMPHGVIAADQRGNPVYDVETGIPATESLYLNVFSKNYLFGYEFENVTGEKEYQITFTKTYHLTWEEINYDDDFNVVLDKKSQTKTVTKTARVKREYFYWKLVQLEYYQIKEAEIWNEALPEGGSRILPENYSPPELDYSNGKAEQEYLKEPEYQKKITLPSETIDGEFTCPEIPLEDFQTMGEEKLGKIKVRNDKLSFGGKNISDDEWKETKAEKPIVYDKSAEIGEDVLYKNNQVIPMETGNDIFETTGIITYQAIARISSDGPEQLLYAVEDLGEVTVHTPTVCSASVSNEKAYNQMLTPDKRKAALVLDRTFELKMPTEGEHLQIRGYGLRDYGKYIAERQVQFPFDVYKGKRYYKANTWISVNSDHTVFYIPVWVKEGGYTIDCRAVSISASANEAEDMEEELANLQRENYVATCQIPVEVSGRVYGFQIRDISDYPLWYSVFRKPDSLEHSGVRYFAGERNQDGIRRSDVRPLTIPLVKGSHIYNPQAGITATGYTFRFSLETVGEMYHDNDYIQLTPKFYYISKEGHKKQEVDLYYTETVEQQRYSLVKTGSQIDLRNVKDRYLGDPYMAVPKDEIDAKRQLTRKSELEFLFQPKPMFTFHHILLSEYFRTYTGKNYTPDGTIPAGVEPNRVSLSKQKWYGEYYLPSQVHAVPKGFDLEQAEQESGSFDFQEDIWLQDGYLLIHFDIVTIRDNKKYLSYGNFENAKSGYCNMWRQEGFVHEKTDSDGEGWDFEDGDVFLYDTGRRAGLDYRTGGTH